LERKKTVILEDEINNEAKKGKSLEQRDEGKIRRDESKKMGGTEKEGKYTLYRNGKTALPYLINVSFLQNNAK
jgi:hypothetical protein